MIKVWGRANSSNVQKVMWTLAELDLDCERIDVGGKFGGLDTVEFAALNPNRLVPAVEDGELKLWESNTIVRYLAVRHGLGKLAAEDPGDRALQERWMDWALGTVGPAFLPVFWQLVRTAPEQRDMSAVDQARKKTAALLQVLESHLGDGRAFIEGAFSMADIPIGIVAYRWFELAIDRPPLPRIEAWYARLTQRAPFKTHCMLPIT